MGGASCKDAQGLPGGRWFAFCRTDVCVSDLQRSPGLGVVGSRGGGELATGLFSRCCNDATCADGVVLPRPAQQLRSRDTRRVGTDLANSGAAEALRAQAPKDSAVDPLGWRRGGRRCVSGEQTLPSGDTIPAALAPCPPVCSTSFIARDTRKLRPALCRGRRGWTGVPAEQLSAQQPPSDEDGCVLPSHGPATPRSPAPVGDRGE